MKVFISYRREDSAGHTGRLYDSLRKHFGDDNVFLDVSGIDSGRKFADVIQGAIHSCDVLLAVIGPEWLTCVANGERRIDDPGDLVRTEILTALNGGIGVIPVLVGGASPPPAGSLPAALQPLAALDAHDMTDERWAYDADRLIRAMERCWSESQRQVWGRGMRGSGRVTARCLSRYRSLWDRTWLGRLRRWGPALPV